jgi:hypothetical protein
MELDELIEKLKKAGGPDRALDAAIDATLRIGKPNHQTWVRDNFPTWRGRPGGRCEVVHSCGDGGVHWESEPFTASVDAALALLERVLPGWQIEQLSWESKPNGLVVCSIGNFGEGEGYINASNDEPAPICFAILIAALTALKHKEPTL